VERARLFAKGKSQAVQLPEALRFQGREVYAARLGTGVILWPVVDPWSLVREAAGAFDDRFMARREQPDVEERKGWR
jgi:antitoxin VapB